MRVAARPPPKTVGERQRAYRQRQQEARAKLAECEARCAALQAQVDRQMAQLAEYDALRGEKGPP